MMIMTQSDKTGVFFPNGSRSFRVHICIDNCDAKSQDDCIFSQMAPDSLEFIFVLVIMTQSHKTGVFFLKRLRIN
jgi:hypothetical protein